MQNKTAIRLAIASVIVVALVGAALTTRLFFATAQGPRVLYGETVTGDIVSAGDDDTWTFDGVRGDIIFVTVEHTGGTLIPSITLTDPDATLIVELAAQNTDASATQLTIGLQRSGTHAITVSGASNTTGIYALSLTLQEAGEPAGSDNAILAYGRTASSTIDDTLYREFWSFRGLRGDVIDVSMTATSGDLDAYVSLISPEGNVIAVSDDDVGTQDAALYSVTLESSGTYTIAARRAGANFGEGGTTQGDYDLTLTLREAGRSETLPTPVVLTQGRITRGRLTTDAPTALFSIEAQGVLALNLNMTDPSQIGTLSIMTEGRALLHIVAGPSPLHSSVTLPGPGTYWVEVSTTDVRDNAPVDFGLTVTPLTVAKRASRSLYYDQPQIIAADTILPEAWHFSGNRGDLLTLTFAPFGPVLEGSLLIYDPDGTLVIERLIRDSLMQPLLLTSSGQYEIVFEPSLISTGYEIGIRHEGLAGIAFDQYAEPQQNTALQATATSPATGTVEPFGTDAWTVDVTRSELWAFTLTATNTNLPLVLALETPDGTLLARTVTEQLTRTARIETRLPLTGRYRVLVIDLNGADPTTYTLYGQPGEGGMLTPKITENGVLTSTTNYDTWTIDAAPGKLLTVRVEVQETAAPVPDSYILGPDGAVIRSTQYIENNGVSTTLSAYTDTGGRQTILVRRPPQSDRLAYHITADVTAMFDDFDSLQFGVNTNADGSLTAESTAVPTIKTVRLADTIAPLLSAESLILQDARRVEIGTMIRGEIDAYARYQAWEFPASAAQMLEFGVTALEDESGPDLVILNANNAVVVEKFVTETTTNYLTHRFAANGTYRLLVKLDNGGRYTLWINTLNRVNERVPEIIRGSALEYGHTVREQLADSDDKHSFVFFGQAGDAITAKAIAVNGPQALKLDLGTVSAGVLATVSAVDNTQPVTLNTRLTETGLYQLDVSLATAEVTTSSTFALHLAVEGTTEVFNAIGGVLDSEHTAYLGAAGTVHHWLVSGRAGERITVNVTASGANAAASLTAQLADSGGTVIEQRQAQLGQETITLNDILLPRSGVYQVLVSSGQGPGLYRISLQCDFAGTQDAERTIQYGATTGKVLTGENFLDIWTFAGSQGDEISIAAQAVRGDDALLSVQLRTDTGQVLATVASEYANGAARVDALTLPATGHYSIAVGNLSPNSQGETAYDITLLLRGTSARAMGSTLHYGDTVQSTFYVDDPIDTWVFEGQEGDTVAAHLSSSDPGLHTTLSLLSTDWHAASSTGQQQILISTEADGNGSTELEFVLPATGTYALTARDTALHGGSYTLELANRNPIAGPAQSIRFDQAREGQITSATPVNAWQFEGSKGMEITITVIPDSRGDLSAHIILLGPNGRIIAQATAPLNDEAQLTKYVLPYQGTYTVHITRAHGETGYTEGRYSIVIHQDATQVIESTPLAYGEIQRGTLDAATPSEHWNINGQHGDTIRIRLERTSGTLAPVLRVYDSSGGLVAETRNTQNGNASLLVTIPAEDRYTVEAARYHGVWGTTSGNYTLVVDRVYQTDGEVGSPRLAYGERVNGTTDGETRSNLWPFKGQAGDVITATITFLSDDAPLTLTLRDAAGNSYVSGTRNANTVIIDRFTLPVDAVYTLEVRRPGDATARFSPYTLTLNLIGIAAPSVSPSGTLLRLDHGISCQFGSMDDTHTWFFNGRASDTFSLALLPVYGALNIELSLVSPDGTTLFTNTVDRPNSAYTTGRLYLPIDGLYMILVHNRSNLPNAMYRLALQSVEQITSTNSIATGDDRVGMITSAQAVERWRLAAQAGTSISLRVSRLSGDLIPNVRLLGPDNRILVTGYADATGQATITAFPILEGGDYTVVVGRDGGLGELTAGSYMVMLREHPISLHAAVAQKISTNSAVIGYVDESGPQLYAFDAQAGDVLAISAQLHDSRHTPLTLVAETEAGRALAMPVVISETETYFEALPAPYTGRYVVAVASEQTAAYTLVVHQRSREPAGNSVTRALGFGQTLAEVVSSAGEPTYWYFTGTQGNVVTITVDTTGSNLRADTVLYGPDGVVAQSTENAVRQTVIGPVRLPSDGDYVLTVGAWLGAAGDTTGRFTVRIDRASEGESGSSGGTIPIYACPVNGGLIPGDSRDIWTFEGLVGEVVTIRVAHAPTNSTVALKLIDPENNTVGTSLLATEYQGAEIRDAALLLSGRYTLQVDAQFANDDPVEYELVVQESQSNLLITSVAQAQGIAYGETRSGALQADQLFEAWVFYGNTGDRIRGVLTPTNAALTPTFYILDPSGAILRGQAVHPGDGSTVMDEITLNTGGFFALVIENTGGTFTEYTISLDRLATGAGYRGEFTGNAEGTLTASTPAHEWTLRVDHAGQYAIVVQPQTLAGPPTVTLTSKTSTILVENTVNIEGAIVASSYLEADTDYSVVVSAGLGVPNTLYSLNLLPARVLESMSDILPGKPNVGRINSAHLTDEWRFTSPAETTTTITVARISGDLQAFVSLFDENGLLISETEATSDGRAVLSVELAADSHYRIAVSRSGLGGGFTGGDYAIEVVFGAPDQAQ